MDNLKEELEKLNHIADGIILATEEELLALFESYVKARRPDKKDRTVTDSEGELVYFYQSKWDKGYNQCSEDYEQSLLGGNKQ